MAQTVLQATANYSCPQCGGRLYPTPTPPLVLAGYTCDSCSELVVEVTRHD